MDFLYVVASADDIHEMFKFVIPGLMEDDAVERIKHAARQLDETCSERLIENLFPNSNHNAHRLKELRCIVEINQVHVLEKGVPIGSHHPEKYRYEHNSDCIPLAASRHPPVHSMEAIKDAGMMMYQLFSHKNPDAFQQQLHILKPKCIANQFDPHSMYVKAGWPDNVLRNGEAPWPPKVGHVTLPDPLNSDKDPYERHGSLPAGSFFPAFGELLPVRLACMFLQSFMMELTHYLADRREFRLPSVVSHMVAEIIRLKVQMGNPPTTPVINSLRMIEDIALYGQDHQVWTDTNMKKVMNGATPKSVWFDQDGAAARYFEEQDADLEFTIPHGEEADSGCAQMLSLIHI